MKVIVGIYNFLKGKKCYLIGVAVICHGVYLITEAQVAEGIKMIELGFAIMAGRAAISKGLEAVKK
jgi:hypothetical protein